MLTWCKIFADKRFLALDCHRVINFPGMQVAEAALRPSVLQPENRRTQTGLEQRRMRASAAAAVDEERPPQQWSREEAMLRTCCWGGLGPAAWQPSAIGGSDVFRSTRSYAADRYSASAGQVCTKNQASTANLLPGLMLYWCTSCSKCILFHVMGDVESPR